MNTATAKQRAWRAEFARRYGHKKARLSRSKAGGGKVARRYGSRARSHKGSGMLGMGSPKRIALGLIAGIGATALTGNKVIGAAIGFAVGGPVAAAGGYFAPEIKGAADKALAGVLPSAASVATQ